VGALVQLVWLGFVSRVLPSTNVVEEKDIMHFHYRGGACLDRAWYTRHHREFADGQSTEVVYHLAIQRTFSTLLLMDFVFVPTIMRERGTCM
jgi:hypothetical protein